MIEDCIANPAALEKYLDTKRQANSKVKEFSLTFDEYICITQSDCYYCGSQPSEVWYKFPEGLRNVTRLKPPDKILEKGKVYSYICNDIDRIDNNLGYTMDNCISFCWDCSRMKMTKSRDEFIRKSVAIAIKHYFN